MSKNKHSRNEGGTAVAEHTEDASQKVGGANNAEQGQNLASEGTQVNEDLVVSEHPAVESDEKADPKNEIKLEGAQLEELKKSLSPEQVTVLEGLQAEIANLSKPKKVASGSKARPNVVYTLLSKPPKWSDTPQVAQIEQILFGQPKTKLTEPEIFDLIKQGFEAGVLRTRQNPVRIFQYYRANLISENVLIYQ